MKVEKGRRIIITDPCYFAKDSDWDSKFDFNKFRILSPEFSDYVWVNTGFGDGTGKVFTSESPKSQYELEEIIIKLRNGEDIEGFNSVGSFGVDSGTFGVFYYDEVLRYYPDFAIEIGSWCYTIIDDFEGVIYDTSIDDNDERHEGCYCYNYLIGSGNKSICTIW